MSDYNDIEPITLLTDWIAEQPDTVFPTHAGRPYPRRLESVATYLNSQVHPQVEKGAILKDHGFLTDHGPEHIRTVIERASHLLSYPKNEFPKLSPYEVYLLLMAIHFHDVGNIFGRKDHEKQHQKVMDKLGTLVGEEEVEKRAILKIARVHGGTIGDDKDTISSLPHKDLVLTQRVRYQALGAILRFADELADDCHRAARFPLLLGGIPDTSVIFHEYARSLHSVGTPSPSYPKLIQLRYQLEQENATRTFSKKIASGQVEQVYLLDEIYERTMKMYNEQRYCMRFLQGIVQVDAIDVRIDICNKNALLEDGESIRYLLREQGYPGSSNMTIQDLCPDSEIISGSVLSEKLTTGE